MNAKITTKNLPPAMRDQLIESKSLGDAMMVFDAWSRNCFVDQRERTALLANLRKEAREQGHVY